jgi:cobalt ECF transporter T component CbiQ
MSRGANFVERTMEGLLEAMERALYAESVAGGAGLLQPIDPRVKVAGLLALIVTAAVAARLWVIGAILAVAILGAVLSRISIAHMASRVWMGALTFTGAIAVPAIFLTPGRVVWRLPGLMWPVTAQGLTTASYLVLRVETAATLALLLIFTTPWAHVLKALRTLRVPVVFVVVLGMTCRYIFLMLDTAHQMFESRKSRTVGELDAGDRRRLAVASAGVLLSRTMQLSGEVYLAMQARGFRGEVYVLDDFAMRGRDWLALATFGALTGAAVWAGR